MHGYCIGPGAHLLEACDLAIVAEDARIGHPEQRFGFCGTAFVLTNEILHLVPKKAREMLLLGDLVDGREAKRLGLVKCIGNIKGVVGPADPGGPASGDASDPTLPSG